MNKRCWAFSGECGERQAVLNYSNSAPCKELWPGHDAFRGARRRRRGSRLRRPLKRRTAAYKYWRTPGLRKMDQCGIMGWANRRVGDIQHANLILALLWDPLASRLSPSLSLRSAQTLTHGSRSSKMQDARARALLSPDLAPMPGAWVLGFGCLLSSERRGRVGRCRVRRLLASGFTVVLVLVVIMVGHHSLASCMIT
jgi:hypothetical protein